MKRIALFFLIACLCCSFVACDMGNGLVAELFGDLKDVTIGEHVYPTDEYIPIETDILIDIEPMPPVEIETTPPYEIGTEHWTEAWTTQPETGCDCGSCDLDEPREPFPEKKFSIYCLVAVLNGQEVIDCFYEPGQEDTWNYQADVDGSISELIVRGCWRCPEKDVLLGYSINGGEIIWDESFINRQHQEITIDGTAYLSYCDIVIPTYELDAGSYNVTCYANMKGYPEDYEYTEQLFEFVINRDSSTTTASEETAVPDVEEPIID